MVDIISYVVSLVGRSCSCLIVDRPVNYTCCWGKISRYYFLQPPCRTRIPGSLVNGFPGPHQWEPWARSLDSTSFQEMENFRQGEPSIFSNMEEFYLMKPTSRRLYKSDNSPQARDRLLQGLETRVRRLELGFL